MSTTLTKPATTILTGDSWIPFEGSAESDGDIVILRPSVDESATLELPASDVREQDGQVEVRLGASILNVDALKGYGQQAASMSSSFGARKQCDYNSTACIGNTEMCCHTGKIIGRCDGYWGCR
jgi:hypothetical protein